MIEILKRKTERYKYIENLDYYLGKVRKIAEKHLGEVEIHIFGSFAEGKNAPSSDVDVLIRANDITPEKRNAVISEVYKKLGSWHPFEIHIVDERGFDWYRRFCRKMIRKH